MTSSPPDTIALLNRLRVLHARSLAMYLSYATPWVAYGREEAGRTLERVVADQKTMVDRISTMILDLGGTLDHGHFPMSFTGLHDVSLDYALDMLVERQKREIAAIEKVADALRLAPMAQALAYEALGESKAHLDMFEGVRRPGPATVA